MDISRVADWLKLPTKTLAALCFVAAILLFSSTEFLSTVGLADLVETYRGYVGGVFLITLSLVFVNAAAATWTFFRPWVVQAYLIWQGKKRLQSLTPDEKAILAYYIQNQTRSQSLDIKSGTVNALQRDKIILRGSNLGTYFGFDFVIQPWAWEHLNNHPELLEN